ncbi:MAG: hypothetical protein IT435_02505 [Phycisphaerales bacterium]|nr:hypothetical protein [Phycisphaerales bacterium]
MSNWRIAWYMFRDLLGTALAVIVLRYFGVDWVKGLLLMVVVELAFYTAILCELGRVIKAGTQDMKNDLRAMRRAVQRLRP